MHEAPQFDPAQYKQKYLEILQAEGISAALTALHKDIERWENQSFEGTEGYDPDFWKKLEEVRSFHRELWAQSIDKTAAL
jgi:hypothetical protein